MLYKICRTAFASLARRNISIHIHISLFFYIYLYLICLIYVYYFTIEQRRAVVFCPQIGVL
jgi:hypothetical protein